MYLVVHAWSTTSLLRACMQGIGNCEQAASKAIAAFATAAAVSHLLVTRLDDDKATTNALVRYAWPECLQLGLHVQDCMSGSVMQ